jgi:hypothetical protein
MDSLSESLGFEQPVLIRQHSLDPMQVKAYAADFCGTPILKEGSRELVC